MITQTAHECLDSLPELVGGDISATIKRVESLMDKAELEVKRLKGSNERHTDASWNLLQRVSHLDLFLVLLNRYNPTVRKNISQYIRDRNKYTNCDQEVAAALTLVNIDMDGLTLGVFGNYVSSYLRAIEEVENSLKNR